MRNPSLERMIENEKDGVGHYKGSSAGFTLIELMISIVLGLLVVAAASQLFFTGLVSSRLQMAGADLQDNGLFGLEYLARDIRLANFGNSGSTYSNGAFLGMNDTTPSGGVVLTADTVCPPTTASTSNLPNVTSGGSCPSPTFLSASSTGPSNATNGGTALLSDQLTVQFQTPLANFTTCEGIVVPTAGTQVMEQFFIRADTTSVSADPNVQNYALACNAGIIVNSVLTDASGSGTFGSNSQIIMNRVDYLHFLLGTQNVTTGKMANYTIAQYLGLASPRPAISSVRVAALVRSMDNSSSATINAAKTFTLFNDQSATPKTSTLSSNRYSRQVYLTTVALRNGLESTS